jgi:hypothetical protein
MELSRAVGLPVLFAQSKLARSSCSSQRVKRRELRRKVKKILVLRPFCVRLNAPCCLEMSPTTFWNFGRDPQQTVPAMPQAVFLWGCHPDMQGDPTAVCRAPGGRVAGQLPSGHALHCGDRLGSHSSQVLGRALPAAPCIRSGMEQTGCWASFACRSGCPPGAVQCAAVEPS